MRTFPWLFLPVALLSSCGSGQQPPAAAPAPAPELLAYFTEMEKLPDTLYVSLDEDSTASRKLIPDSLLLAALDSATVAQLTFNGDIDEAECFALFHFPLDEEHEACLMEIRQYWFYYKPLLVYDLAAQRFSGAQPLAYLYGGESGQIAGESWLMHFSGDSLPGVLTRHQERWLEITENDDLLEHKSDSVSAHAWDGMAFKDYPLADTAALIRQFPMERLW